MEETVSSKHTPIGSLRSPAAMNHIVGGAEGWREEAWDDSEGSEQSSPGVLGSAVILGTSQALSPS